MSVEQTQSARAPVGAFPSRCDEKGRVRLPNDIAEFVKTFGDTEYFVTSIDGGFVVRVYPRATWEANKKILDEFDEDPTAAEDIAYMADYYGSVSPMDAQGRVLISPVLRRKAGIEDQKVQVRFYKDAVEIYSEAESERRLQRAAEAVARNLPALRKRGLK